MIIKAKPVEERLPTLNVTHMSALMFDKRKGGRPKKVRHCLLREDSSDEEIQEKKKQLLEW